MDKDKATSILTMALTVTFLVALAFGFLFMFKTLAWGQEAFAPEFLWRNDEKKLFTCLVDYTFCAGELVKQQASFRAAAAVDRLCRHDEAPAKFPELFDLERVPSFGSVAECHSYVAACGYTVFYTYSAVLGIRAQMRENCAELKTNK